LNSHGHCKKWRMARGNDANTEGMTINGVLLTELIRAYEK